MRRQAGLALQAKQAAPPAGGSHPPQAAEDAQARPEAGPRWIGDVGAVFVQLDADSTVIATTVRERVSTAKDLRRAQVLAAETDIGRTALVELIEAKLEQQAQLAERVLVCRPPPKNERRPGLLMVPEQIREQGVRLHEARSIAELRKIESIAGRAYWQSFAQLPIRFDAVWRGALREAAAAAGPLPRDQLVGLFDALRSACRREGYHGCAFINTAAEAPPGSAVHVRTVEHKAAVREWVRELAAAAHATDPDTLARELTLLLDGGLSAGVLDGDPAAADAAARAAALLVAAAAPATSS